MVAEKGLPGKNLPEKLYTEEEGTMHGSTQL